MIKNLALAKETEKEVEETIENLTSEIEVMMEIRENYRNLGRIASILYFVVNDLSKIEPMY